MTSTETIYKYINNSKTFTLTTISSQTISQTLNKTNHSSILSNHYILLIVIGSVLLITIFAMFVIFKYLNKKIKTQTKISDITKTSYDNPLYERNEINDAEEYLEIDN